jgi:hypothetical protein
MKFAPSTLKTIENGAERGFSPPFSAKTKSGSHRAHFSHVWPVKPSDSSAAREIIPPKSKSKKVKGKSWTFQHPNFAFYLWIFAFSTRRRRV